MMQTKFLKSLAQVRYYLLFDKLVKFHRWGLEYLCFKWGAFFFV